MKLVLLSRLPITSKKDSKKYFIYKGLSLKGDVVEFVLNEEDEKLHSIPANSALTQTQINDLFSAVPTTLDVSFNNRGRVETVEINS